MSQRFFSLADSFSIKDEQDRVVATVSKRWFSATIGAGNPSDAKSSRS